jgi:aerobic carbon-monoxide dehydrogenase large subunit
MQKFGIGQPVRRVEDVRFITGEGAFTDDLNLPGQAIAYMLRSPYGHARIKSMDTTDAMASPGVVGIITGADLAADSVGPLPCVTAGIINNRDGSPIAQPPHPALVSDTVRFVGDGVAFVIAETLNQAKDAAELIDIDWDDLQAAASIEAAEADGAPQIHEEAADNVCFDWDMGDAAGVDEAFAKAAHISSCDVIHNRVIPHAMETRAALGEFNTEEDRYVLRTSTQGANGMRDILAGMILGIAPDQLRIITPDVGGGFGMKTFVYPEQVLVLYAAKKLGRAVKWTGDRSDSFQSDSHGRDWITHTEMAIDENNQITGLRVQNRVALGAYLSQFAPFVPSVSAGRILGGVYKIPVIHYECVGLFTNAVPVDAYRGAGRPEAAYIIERSVNQAAAELGLSQDEFRRMNFIGKEEMPYQHPFGFVFDSGDYNTNLDDAMKNADWAGFDTRKAESAANGKLRGIGLAYYIECTLGGPSEDAVINFLEDETVEIITGTMSNGQGHETAWAQVVAEQLGVPFHNIKLVQGDTDRVATGGGTGGSHSLYMAAGAFKETSEVVVDKGKLIASLMLDADKDEIDFSEGLFAARGTNRTVGILDVAAKARQVDELPGEFQEMFVNGLNSQATYAYETSTFPNGCHICEVEIDPDTGNTDIVAYTVVDDFGKIINPILVAGQVHGGVVQGIGQALTEHCVYDPDTGQLLTGSFMDYGMPRADDMPHISFQTNEVLCTTNPYGIKGCGEAGTIGACPSSINAIIDALKDYGVKAIDMPATPLKIWQAINDGSRQAAE